MTRRYSSKRQIIAPKHARRVRPNMPHYGVLPDQVAGMLEWDWVEGQMASARNYWIATANADGSPHCAPVWGIWFEGEFIFGTDKRSVKARNIQRDNRAIVHLESGDDTLIMHGILVHAQLSPDLQERMGQAYVEKYHLDPQMGETDNPFFRLLPRKVMAWLESDYPATATCWHFDD